jgi:hypothetical protein
MSPKTCFATEFPSGERSEQTFHKRCVNQEQFSGMEEGQLAALAKLAKLAIFDKRRGPDRKSRECLLRQLKLLAELAELAD